MRQVGRSVSCIHLCGGSGMIRFSDKTQKITFDFDCWANGVHLISLQYM